jgi:hypothetical protein
MGSNEAGVGLRSTERIPKVLVRAGPRQETQNEVVAKSEEGIDGAV